MPVREVAFELQCFEWADERLEVAGRWKGLTGRGLARPVLTVDTESGKRKRLVALPGGHFGAAAESWRAAFDWPGDPAEITGAELEVGGNIVVDLPLPDRRRRRRRRPHVDPGDEALRAEIVALRAQIERLRAELAGRERENMQLRSRIDEGGAPESGAGSPTVEIERLTGEQAQLTAELERLAQQRDRMRAELSSEIERLHGERERMKAEIDALREAFSDAADEAEESRDRHRAELARLEEELRAERAAVARLSAQLAERPGPPPPATGSARRAAVAMTPEARTDDATSAPGARDDETTEAMPPPDAAGDEATTEATPPPDAAGDDETTEAMPPPGAPGADDAGASAESPQSARAVVDAASLPGALNPPGPMRAGARPATPAGDGDEGGSSRIPAWLRSRRADSSGDAGLGPSAAAFAADEVSEDPGPRPEPAPSPALRAAKARLGDLLVPNGHASAEVGEPEVRVPRPRRTATAARARAGATVAARRSAAELWALRILAVALVAVLLIAFLLILTRVA